MGYVTDMYIHNLFVGRRREPHLCMLQQRQGRCHKQNCWWCMEQILVLKTVKGKHLLTMLGVI